MKKKRLIFLFFCVSLLGGRLLAENNLPQDILITEIMANPDGSTYFPETGYIEIFNNTASSIDLKDWFLIAVNEAIALPDLVLSAGQYAILYEDGKTIHIDAGGLAVPLPAFPSDLTNLKIESPDGTEIDAVTCPAPTPARSWERDGDGNMYLSNDLRGGTPGSVNSPAQTPPVPDVYQYGDIWINEVMVNPGVAPSEFGNAEYVEIYNASSAAINLKGWKFIYHSSATSSTVLTLPDVSLPVGGYAVLYRSDKILYVDKGGIAIPFSNFPATLGNTGRLLEIKSPGDVLIYDYTYPNSSSFVGSSWERDYAGNYFLSNDPRGGTPGSVNSPDNVVGWGDIWINEIMVNPGTTFTLGNAEYVELYNASGNVINLRNWKLIYHANTNSNTVVTIPGIILPAGGYAVIYRADDKLSIDVGGIAIPIANFPSTLANAGRLLEVKNSKDVLIDAVNYPNSDNYSGCSWERDGNGNYFPSNDPHGGTPGSVNSTDNSRAGDIRINEIMVNPGGNSTLGDAEYVELFNTTASAINVRGWFFIYHANATSSTVVTLPGVTIPAGGYAVLYRTGDKLVIDAGVIVIQVANFPSTLGNTGRLLELKNSLNVLIDAVEYPNSTNLPGCSWERDNNGNLYPSNDPRGGTPGSVNSYDNSRSGNIGINEIMVMPVGSKVSETEYVELYNLSPSEINLQGWKLVYDSRTVVTIPGVLLPSGGYAVLYRSDRIIHVDAGGIPIPLSNFPSTLANTGRLLELKNSRDVLIDSVTYSNSTLIPGCSWERDRTGTFYPSSDPRGGTPGSVNSSDNSRPGDLWINEIMVNPTGATGLPETEYVELYNTSDVGINLRGWTLIYDSRTVVTLPGVILSAGGYAVLYREGKDIRIDAGGSAIPVANFPSTLAKEGRLVEIKNSRGVLIDYMTYKNSASLAGCSWERDRDGYFYPSNDPRGGTPGSVNTLDNSRFGDVWINEIMANPTGATVLPETEYVELYNASGMGINVRGWSLIYDSRTVVILPGIILPPGGYGVLYRTGKDIRIAIGGISIPVGNFPATLANEGRLLELKNSKDILIDSVTYPNSTKNPGRSWERDRTGYYYLSNDSRGGTPGSVNSPTEIPVEPDFSIYGDVWINEVMADPRGLKELPETEYIELLNASESPINLRGWSLIYDERVNMPFPDVILPVNGYAVLYRSSKEILIDNGGIAIPVANFPVTLANSGRKLALTNSLSVLIDSITYA
ncbi:MAG: lamin tail domain-containing protein, partial [Tannerella sp.]|nr:lamin tail domain-containing protein [Tannerella sp.]